jgi:hypothetical protein
MGVRDVPGEVSEDDSPGEWVFPGAAANADVLTLFGDPDTEDLEGRFVALRYWWNAKNLFDTHTCTFQYLCDLCGGLNSISK